MRQHDCMHVARRSKQVRVLIGQRSVFCPTHTSSSAVGSLPILTMPNSHTLLAVRVPVQPKEETWWLVAGDAANDELLALKRVSLSHTATARLTLAGTSLAGQALQGVMLHLVSGCYMGLDQQAWVARQ